jgi:DNA invertase Pin-like site-specific DNA recombinase
MREAALRGEFKVLYVHKVDRLASYLEWSLEIVHELQELDIIFKAVRQPVDLSASNLRQPLPSRNRLDHAERKLNRNYPLNMKTCLAE